MNTFINKSKKPKNLHENYHAHVYFDESSKKEAKNLCDATAEKFGLEVGRFHEKLVGPHPCWSCQIKFNKDNFNNYIAWLEEKRGGLTVFVHGLTGNDLKDHTEYAYWLGQEVELNLEIFNNF